VVRYFGEGVHTVEKVLNSHGEATCAEIIKLTGLKSGTVSATLHRMRSKGLIYVKGYERTTGKQAAIFTWGNKPDATFTPMKKSEISKKHKAKLKMLRTQNSVFNTGLTFKVAQKQAKRSDK